MSNGEMNGTQLVCTLKDALHVFTARRHFPPPRINGRLIRGNFQPCRPIDIRTGAQLSYKKEVIRTQFTIERIPTEQPNSWTIILAQNTYFR